jgi:hypothetical protein
LYRRLGGPQGRSGRVRKISPTPGFDPRNVRSVASRYVGGTVTSLQAGWPKNRGSFPDNSVKPFAAPKPNQQFSFSGCNATGAWNSTPSGAQVNYYYYYYLTAIGLTLGGSSTVHIYTQTVHRIPRTEHT